MKIRIISKEKKIIAELNSSETARKIFSSLPIKAKAQRWGDEIYFEIPLKLKKENPKDVVNMGDLGYWLEGNCFCIFFGKTPISNAGEIRPASPVNVFGRIVEGIELLREIKNNDSITVEKIKNGTS